MRVFVKSFGCSTNLADGEVLAGCLARAGMEIVDSASAADVVVYNTCAVKGPTENRMIEVLRRVPTDKKLVVAGCLPLINFERLRRDVRFDGVVGPAAAERVVDVVKQVCNGEQAIAIERVAESLPSLKLPRLRLNPVVGIIPINYGCLGSCAYCCVVFARGRLKSYRIEAIVERVREDLAAGVREFWLTSQDTACYGRDLGVSLADLLEAVCDVDGDFKIRVGMMNPNLTLNILNGLVEAFGKGKVFRFIHLPVQSGDDEVLRRMQRRYSVEEFKKVVEVFRASFPELTLATDVICGFPGESSAAFEETLQLVEEVKPDVVNVSKFFARPGTVAAEMREGFVSNHEIKRRSALLSGLARRVASERNRRWVGWEGEVLVDEVGKVSGSWVGRNFAYKPVVVKDLQRHVEIGECLRVRVVGSFPTYLLGDVVE